jgi:hypothetical protein
MTTALKRRLDKLERDVFYRIAVRGFMKECLSVLSGVSPEAAERLMDQLSHKKHEWLKKPQMFAQAFRSQLAGLNTSARKKVRDDLTKLMRRYERR